MAGYKLIGMLVLVAVFFSPVFSQCLTHCMEDCCGKYGGALLPLEAGKTDECDRQAGCMVMFLGSLRGEDDLACVKYAGATNYNKNAISQCMDTCMSGCEGPDYGPSPFSGGPDTYEEPEPPQGVCADVKCPSSCVYEDGLPILYYDGRCFENNQTFEGYECGYVRGQCKWKCNSAGDGCDDEDPLSVIIDSPEHGAKLDTGKLGYAYVNVTGSISSSPEHTVHRVTVSAGLLSPSQAEFNANTRKFHFYNLKINNGKPALITVTAYDSANRRLGSKTVTVYPSPKLINLLFSKKSVNLWRNGELIGGDWTEGTNAYEAMEGDEFEVSGDGHATAIYSDGTYVILKAPCRIKFYKNAIHLIKGAIEVDVKHSFTVLGRLGYHVVKGTKFKVIVPDDENIPESLIVLRGEVLSGLQDAPENAVEVKAGQHLYHYPGIVAMAGSVGAANAAELQSFEEGGEVTTPDVQGDSPTGWSSNGRSAGCCAGIIILVGILLAFLYSRQDL